jgi:predicted permease
MEALKISNLKKPSNKKWKMIADYLLYTALPALNIFFVAIQPVSPEFTIWSMAITTLLITLFKGGTKFTAETTQPWRIK